MNYPTCGEISCEECNDRYEKAMDRIAELEAMVRELVEATEAEYHVVAGDQYHMLCPGSAIKVNRAQILNAARAKALALLNSGNEGNSADQ